MLEKNPTHFLSLIIPVFKQEKTIVANLKQIQSVLETLRYDYEIIVVVDGKVDAAFEKIQDAKFSKIRSFTYEKNHGKSYAVRFGMQKAKGDYVMFLDSGMEIDPNGISMLLDHMEWYDADIIVGSKRHPVSQVNYSWQRKILSDGYYILVKLLFGIKIKDTQAGIKIFRKKVLEQTLPRLVEKKFAGDLEMLVAANTLGYHKIYEAPIKLTYNVGEGASTAATFSAIFNILYDTLAIWYRKNILRYYEAKK